MRIKYGEGVKCHMAERHQVWQWFWLYVPNLNLSPNPIFWGFLGKIAEHS